MKDVEFTQGSFLRNQPVNFKVINELRTLKARAALKIDDKGAEELSRLVGWLMRRVQKSKNV